MDRRAGRGQVDGQVAAGLDARADGRVPLFRAGGYALVLPPGAHREARNFHRGDHLEYALGDGPQVEGEFPGAGEVGEPEYAAQRPAQALPVGFGLHVEEEAPGEAGEPAGSVGLGGHLDPPGEQADEMRAVFPLQTDFVVMENYAAGPAFGAALGRGFVRGHSALSIRTSVPPGTPGNAPASPVSRPRGFTALAARGASSTLAGVLPKKMQNALPGGQ